MTSRSSTDIRRDAFPTIDQALECARAALDQAATGGVTVQIQGGSSRWPDPATRFRVTTSVTREQ